MQLGNWDGLEPRNRAVKRVEPPLMVDGGRGAGEKEPLAGTRLVDEVDDGPVGGEPVMVEALQRPLPSLVAETRHQPARVGPCLVHGDRMSHPAQVVGSRQAGDPSADDADVHSILSPARPTGQSLAASLSPRSSAPPTSRHTAGIRDAQSYPVTASSPQPAFASDRPCRGQCAT